MYSVVDLLDELILQACNKPLYVQLLEKLSIANL